jgi:hypothetical protein
MTLRQRRRFPAARRATTVLAAAGTALAGTLLTAPGAHAADSDIAFSNVVINKGRSVALGTSGEVEVPQTYTLKTNTKLDSWWITVYRGPYGEYGHRNLPGITTRWSCAESAAGGYTFYDCNESINIDADYLTNSDATVWKTAGTALKAVSGYDEDLFSATVRLKRASVIASADASPEPVTKGQPITVKGTLKRANWSTNRYDTYAGQSVTLQFKAAGSTTYTNVKSVTTSSTGAFKTTVTAAKDGAWRWYYAGNSITGAKVSAGDYVDVR